VRAVSCGPAFAAGWTGGWTGRDGRLRSVAGSSPFVRVLLAIVTWNVVFLAPSGGLDQGWEYGLYAAAHDGLHFGTDIVFTYGPLGFLRSRG
jgi:hypothetical protein